jgi:hypothetical protein
MKAPYRSDRAIVVSSKGRQNHKPVRHQRSLFEVNFEPLYHIRFHVKTVLQAFYWAEL